MGSLKLSQNIKSLVPIRSDTDAFEGFRLEITRSLRSRAVQE